MGTTGEAVADHAAAVEATDGAGDLVGRHHGDISAVVGSERAGRALLVLVAGADDDAGLRDVAHEPGDGGQPHRAGAEHGDDRCVGVRNRRALGREQRGVDASCEGLDQHRLLVGRVGVEAVELALVGDELWRPPTAGRAAEPGLDAGLDLAAAQVAAA